MRFFLPLMDVFNLFIVLRADSGRRYRNVITLGLEVKKLSILSSYDVNSLFIVSWVLPRL